MAKILKALLVSLVFVGSAHCGIIDYLTDKLNDTDGIQNPVRGKFEFLGNLHTENVQSQGKFDSFTKGIYVCHRQ